MLFAVTRGHKDYNGGTESLIFLGLPVGRIVDSGLVWCVSDANAATDFVKFTREVEQIGDFVDFDLLCQKWYGKTSDDQHRPSRRAAELLVLNRIPVSMVTHVAAKTQARLDEAIAMMAFLDGQRQYRVEPGFYYD
jgi:ssDNA thymidine ADP-ribosyltransferase, DarT